MKVASIGGALAGMSRADPGPVPAIFIFHLPTP